MKRIVVVASLIFLLSIPSYSYAELTAPTGVTATEGTYSDTIIVSWDSDPDATHYEVWRDSYESCEGAIPCEPEFVLWVTMSWNWNVFEDTGENILPYGQVFEYRIKTCANDEITNETICSDFSLPAYGYILEDAPLRTYDIPPGVGGGGIFGDIIKSRIIGYHLDGFTSKGVHVYMPVTQGFKALKGAQEYVRSFAPGLAEFVRKCFDYLEQKADSNKEGFLYNLGTHVFPIFGKIAEISLALIGEQKYIEAAYSDTTISIEEYRRLEKEGLAIAPKVVKEMDNEKHEKRLSKIVLAY
jgi:hypothetical protein